MKASSRKKTKKTRYLPKSFSGLLMLAVGFVGGYQLHQRIALPPVTVAEGNIHARFSPKGGCSTLAIQTINKAEHTIEAAIYCFNAESIADALIAAHKRGVQVRIVADRSQRNVKNGQLARLYRKKIPIRLASGVKIMHNKTLVIDGRWVLTGSFNWTRPAEQNNAENLLCIKSDELSKQYQNDWQKHWKKAKQYSAVNSSAKI